MISAFCESLGVLQGPHASCEAPDHGRDRGPFFLQPRNGLGAGPASVIHKSVRVKVVPGITWA